MQLRKIDIAGFKSFADRTELTFDGGMTAIVGPNGCGKSNVVDAIRWVLGEQSAKSLRAAAMGECIFSGTTARKPLGFAEVTLTFDNSSGRLATEYEEVAVTRRIYGSGEGEYFLNRKPCRLRDIRELFAGTGVGTTAYSVIEQGEITRIISSDPRELRAVFDEAAGVYLYKSRLRAAEAKLERVALNLLRVNDVLGEVEKSLRSVRYQAAKAERYKTLTARLKNLKMTRARRNFAELSARREGLAEELDSARFTVRQLEASLSRLESDGEEAGARLAAVERDIAEASTALNRLEGEVQGLEHAIAISGERIAHHNENAARLEATIRTWRRDLEGLEIRAVELERRAERIARRTTRLSRAAAAAAQRDGGLAADEESLVAEIGRAEAEAVEVLRAQAKLNNRVSEIDASRRAAAHEHQRLAARRDDLSGQTRALAARRSDLVERRERLAADARARQDELGAISAQKRAREAERAQVGASISAASERLAGVKSRRDLLEDLQRRRDGVSDAARAILDMKLPGTRGLVADLLEVPQDLTAAVEGLLDRDAGTVVVESTSAALEAVKRLCEASAGRAKVISLERAAAHGRARATDGAAGLTLLAGGVAAAGGCEALPNALLGDCLLAESLEAAVSADGQAAGMRVATRQGEVVGPDGGITGGRARETGGLIWRKSEIERLAGLEAELEAQIGGLEALRSQVDASIGRLRDEESAAEKALGEITAHTAEANTAISAADARSGELARETGVVAAEIASLEKEAAEGAAERGAVAAKIEAARLEAAGLEAKIAQLKGRRTEAAARRERIRARLTRLKIELASVIEKQSSLERQLADAQSALTDKAQALEEATRQALAAKNSAEEESARLAAAAARLDEARFEANAVRVVLAARNRDGRALREDAARFAPLVREARTAVDAARQALSQLTVDEREVSVRLAECISRAREEFGATPAELGASAPADPGQADAAPLDPAAADAEIEELTKKLASMGGVNMEALQELDELQNRHSFLAGQRDDLAAAKQSLEGIIAKTRATSRKMFLESFEAVRQHFATMFRRLFGGGRADCILVDPEDVLESPIQIMAKPPGKEPTSLNLLSGGEKAMTAVALLFAMFATRPSPFLVLDEVDAPLDESNIGRFIELMRDFLPTCQFVVITHNRRTMAAADTLYGITMEEQGVSKKVSLSFRESAPTPEPVEV